MAGRQEDGNDEDEDDQERPMRDTDGWKIEGRREA
jgi:hypothetical protein